MHPARARSSGHIPSSDDRSGQPAAIVKKGMVRHAAEFHSPAAGSSSCGHRVKLTERHVSAVRWCGVLYLDRHTKPWTVLAAMPGVNMVGALGGGPDLRGDSGITLMGRAFLPAYAAGQATTGDGMSQVSVGVLLAVGGPGGAWEKPHQLFSICG
jgi:hypothetical protein